MAECFLNLGIQPGDKIGICTENRIEFAYVLFGTILVGATFNPMNPTYTERNIFLFFWFTPKRE